MQDTLTKEKQTTLDELAVQITGRRGTPAHRAVVEWLLAGIRAGRIPLTSECNSITHSTVSEATAAEVVWDWEGKKDLLAALRDGATAAEAVTKGVEAIAEGGYLRGKVAESKVSAAQSLADWQAVAEAARAGLAWTIKLLVARCPEYASSSAAADSALLHSMAADIESDSIAQEVLGDTSYSVIALLRDALDAYAHSVCTPAETTAQKGSKKRGGV